MKTRTGMGQAGDTLVEVLIAILIVSLVLTGAYVTTNRSALGVRNAQEQAEALKLIQGQLEQVRQNGTQSADVFAQTAGREFCMIDAEVVDATANPGATSCRQDSSGQPANEQPVYALTVQRNDCVDYTPPTGLTCHAFTAKAVWDSVTASGQSTSLITYRLYGE